MTLHRDVALGERHPAHNWEYADAAARTAATGFVPADVGKWARQLDNNTFWVLTDDSPVTWASVGGSSYDAEQARDDVGAALTDSTSIAWTKDDPGNTLTAAVILEWLQDTVAAILTGGSHSGITVAYDDTGGTVGLTATVSAYTDEQVRDVVGAALVAGTGIAVTVSDVGDTITINSTVTAYTDEQAQDAVAAAFAAGSHTGITVTYNDAGNAISLSGYTAENARDDIAAALVAGTGISISVSDVADTITINSTVAAYTDEQAQDAVAAALAAGTHVGISVAYSDAGNSISLTGFDNPMTTKGDLISRSSTVPVRVAVGSNGQSLVADSTQASGIKWASTYYTVNFVIDGGGLAITTGIKGDVIVDQVGVIESVTLLADQTGSIVIDIWKDTYANFPPLVGDSITASAKPTLSSAAKSQDTTLTGWTTSLAAGDVLRFNVDSAATVTRVTVSLKVRRTP